MTQDAPDRKPARTLHGRFTRDIAHQARDAEAMRLAIMHVPYAEICAELGYGSRGEVTHAVRKALYESAQQRGTAQMRQEMVEELTLAAKVCWDDIGDPGPATDRLGRVIHNDDGTVVPDLQAKNASMQNLRGILAQLAKLKGLDAPRRSVGVSMSITDVEGQAQYLQAEVDRIAGERKDDEHAARQILGTISEDD